MIVFHHKDFFLSITQKTLLWHCFYSHKDKTFLQQSPEGLGSLQGSRELQWMAANKGSHHPNQTQAGLLPPNFIQNTSAISSSLRKCELRDCLCLLASGFKPRGPTEFLANLITKGSLLTKVGLLRRECGREKELMAEEVRDTPGCGCLLYLCLWEEDSSAAWFARAGFPCVCAISGISKRYHTFS